MTVKFLRKDIFYMKKRIVYLLIILFLIREILSFGSRESFIVFIFSIEIDYTLLNLEKKSDVYNKVALIVGPFKTYLQKLFSLFIIKFILLIVATNIFNFHEFHLFIKILLILFLQSNINFVIVSNTKLEMTTLILISLSNLCFISAI